MRLTHCALGAVAIAMAVVALGCSGAADKAQPQAAGAEKSAGKAPEKGADKGADKDAGKAADKAGADKADDKDADKLTLDEPTQARIGLATEAAKAMQYRAEVQGLGQVMGIDALAQTDTELTSAEAAARASEAARARARGLFAADTSVSRQVLETAQHQATTDESQLMLARRKAIAIWGHDAPWSDPRRRAALLAKISAGTTALVRATLSAGSGGDVGGAPMRLERLDGDGDQNHRSWNAASTWQAPTDPTVPGRSYYLLVTPAEGLSPGERVRVFTPVGPSKAGTLVPAAAVVIAGGSTGVYIEEKGGSFVRRAIAITQPVQDGYVTADVRPGELIVVQGAGQLLARESGTAAGD
jgi:hypothetical protein